MLEMPHRDDLKGKSQPVVIAAPRLDQPPVLVVQVEEPFQLDPRVGAEPAVAALSDHARHDHRRPTPLTIPPLAPDLGRMSLNPLVLRDGRGSQPLNGVCICWTCWRQRSSSGTAEDRN